MGTKHSQSWKAKARHLVLLALRTGPKHGYEITRHVQTISKGYFDIGYGSLYPTLHALEKEGLVTGEWKSVGQKDKKTYKLTKSGKKSLETVAEEYQSFVKAFDLLFGEA